jgi:hypothetical protein
MFKVGTMRTPTIKLHKILLEPVVMYRCETRSKTGQNKCILNARKRNLLKKTYGTVPE